MIEDIYTLRKCGREVYPFLWAGSKAARPWKDGYTRVIIPLTPAEQRHSRKRCHIQIVRNDNIVKVRATK